MLPSKMPSVVAVKSTVRSVLKGRWLLSATVGLLPLFCYYFFSLVIALVSELTDAHNLLLTALLLLAAVFVILPLFYGVLRWFWRITDGTEDDLTSAFYYFANARLYKRVIKLTLVLAFKIGVIFFLCLIPFFAISLFSRFLVYDIFKEVLPVWAINITAFKSLFYTFGTLLAIIISFRYYLVPIIAVMDDNLLILEAVHLSTTVSKKSFSSFLSLVSSNLGWIVASLLVLPLIYTAPFLMGCYVVHSRFAMVNYNLNVEFYEKNRFSGVTL